MTTDNSHGDLVTADAAATSKRRRWVGRGTLGTFALAALLVAVPTSAAAFVAGTAVGDDVWPEAWAAEDDDSDDADDDADDADDADDRDDDDDDDDDRAPAVVPSPSGPAVAPSPTSTVVVPGTSPTLTPVPSVS